MHTVTHTQMGSRVLFTLLPITLIYMSISSYPYLRYRKHAIVDGSGAAQPRLLHERH